MPQSGSVLVVNPYIHDFKLYDEWMHPLGLYYLIDILSANGIDVHYFNCLERSPVALSRKYGTGLLMSREIQRPECYKDIKRKYKCYGCPEETFLHFLRSLSGVDVIFIGSMMTYWAYGILETIRLIKTVLPFTSIICGGIAVRLMPAFFKQQTTGVHFFEGSLLTNNGEAVLPGLSAPLHIPEEPSILPAFTLVSPVCHGPLLLSLGCPMHCSYCASNLLQPVFRRRKMSIVFDEMMTLIEKQGVRDFAFYDDALLPDAEGSFLPFLDQIIGSGVSVRLHTPNGLHLKYITAPLLEKMQRAGFTTLRFGYESGAFKHRHFTGGKADGALLGEKLRLVSQFEFKDTGVYVMGGLPGSSPAEMADEIHSIASYGTKVKPVFLSPVPGTELFHAYLSRFPALATDPLWHNDTFFVTQLETWGDAAVEMIRVLARKLNSEKPPVDT
jgi:hypothetical protein